MMFDAKNNGMLRFPVDLHVPDFEDVSVLHHDVVHVHGLQPLELHGEGDEIDGGSLVELEQARVVVVPLPPKRVELPLKVGVRRDHLAGRRVHQDLPPPAAVGLGPGVLHEPYHPVVVEHPHARHWPQISIGFHWK